MSKQTITDIWYRKESDLRDSLIEHIKCMFGPDQLCYAKREVPVGSIIPDIVIVSTLNEPRRDLWPSRWTFMHAALVWHLRCRSKLTKKSLARRVFENPDRIEPVLEQLFKTGAIIKTETGCYKLGKELRELSATVIAIEAKLKRWKNALSQAMSYISFSDKSIVAMAPDGIPTTKDSKEIFQNQGIGLISVNGGAPQIIYPGRFNYKNCVEREYLIGSALGRVGQTRWSAL